ncbi:MAG: deoxyribonuclease V, partial [Phycisphaerae bacterium]|jgi:deoxyribonuclease V|nr:deoxyribonuclease V [Phycisphaerae bacterium]MDP7290478.1 deoxyribonuclease V [Phycisphaerae bacterium]
MIQHAWNISHARAVAIQRSLAEQVSSEPLSGPVDTVAGTDCAYLDDGKKIAAVAVLCDAKSMEVLESASIILPCKFPYIPGLLSFREAPAVIAVVEKLTRRPDILMCDGQGVAHQRGLGLASHVGLWLDMPSIGVAKSRLCGTHRDPGAKRGCRARLTYNEKVVGAVVRTRTNVKPLYISIGHRVSLSDAVWWTLHCGRGVRVPQPTRIADQLVGQIGPKR